MIDLRMSLLARNLVNYSVAAKKGDKVLIEATDVPTEFVGELIKEVLRGWRVSVRGNL